MAHDASKNQLLKDLAIVPKDIELGGKKFHWIASHAEATKLGNDEFIKLYGSEKLRDKYHVYAPTVQYNEDTWGTFMVNIYKQNYFPILIHNYDDLEEFFKKGYTGALMVEDSFLYDMVL